MIRGDRVQGTGFRGKRRGVRGQGTGFRGRRGGGKRREGGGRSRRQKTRQEGLEFLAVLGLDLLVVLAAHVASAVIADTLSIELDAGERFGENAFGTEPHGGSSLQLTVDSKSRKKTVASYQFTANSISFP
jgi:hypothetical protein